MQVSHVDTVFLWVEDLDRSVDWYETRLGIEPGPRFGAWQSMELGGQTLFALHGGKGSHPTVNAVVAFRVEDLEAGVAHLAEIGESPIDPEITDTGFKRFTTFADPDGNHVQLIELRS